MHKMSHLRKLYGDNVKRNKQLERLRRRILFVIRWSSFDNYWDVVDALEQLASEYRKMLGDVGEIIQGCRNLLETLEREKHQRAD